MRNRSFFSLLSWIYATQWDKIASILFHYLFEHSNAFDLNPTYPHWPVNRGTSLTAEAWSTSEKWLVQHLFDKSKYILHFSLHSVNKLMITIMQICYMLYYNNLNSLKHEKNVNNPLYVIWDTNKTNRYEREDNACVQIKIQLKHR